MKRTIAALLLLLLATGTASLIASDRPLPKLLSAELPMYPEQARMARVAGTVKVSFALNRNGGVAQAEVVSGNVLLRDAALQNVKSWKFRPDSIQPSIRYETQFVYRLDVQQKQGEPRLTVSIVDFRRVEVASELYVEAIE